MRDRNFDEWIDKFRTSIASYEYYVDFKKVYSNVKNMNSNTKKVSLKLDLIITFGVKPRRSLMRIANRSSGWTPSPCPSLASCSTTPRPVASTTAC